MKILYIFSRRNPHLQNSMQVTVLHEFISCELYSVCQASDKQNLQRKPVLPYANNKNADQPAQFDRQLCYRCLDSTIYLVAISEMSRLQLAFVAEQAAFSPTWLQTPKTDFLMTRPI